MGDRKTILVTGGAGYIGSHICVALAAEGFRPIIVDDLSNAHESILKSIDDISGGAPIFYKVDVCDRAALQSIFAKHDISAVIHLAAKKAVEESVHQPLDYYSSNIGGLLSLLTTMKEAGVRHLIYSSSATVYKPTDKILYAEDSELGSVNPYGWTKFMGEQIIKDASSASQLCAGVLRYFNPVGAHESGMIGESPKGKPNNLMPILAQVVKGERPSITIFGNDYDTPDGTAVRDYVHVMDVAEAHIIALKKIMETNCGLVLNIGTGKGLSVLDIITTYERVNGVSVPHVIGPRRDGDAPHICADVSLAKEVLGWSARRDIEVMCRDLHRWISQ